ncbi:hypothetical protein Tco_0758963 [Tanacetum coccineum]
MAIPDPLITEAIQQSSYYPKYLKMVAENTKKTPQGSASMQPATKRATPKKPTTTTPVKQTKPAPPPTKKLSKPQQESIPSKRDDDPDLELAKKLSLETPQEKGEGEGDDADLEQAIKLSLDPAFLPQGRAPVGGVTIRDPVSEATPKLHEVVGKGKAVVTEEQVAHSLIDLKKQKVIRIWALKGDKFQALEALKGDTDPEPMNEDQTGSDSGKLHVSLAGPNPEHMDDEFLATAYPKFLSPENLDDFLTWDQYLHDKNQPEKMMEKSKLERSSDSTIPDLSHQTVKSNSSKELITLLIVLASIRSKFLLGMLIFPRKKLDDALLKVLECHTAGFIEKYSELPGQSLKHDSDDDDEDDDDDEGPSAGSNQGRSTKRRRSDSAASGSAKPPPKADDQSLKKPRESEASASKQHLTLSSTGWQITDTREAGVDSSMHRSDLESEHSEQSSDDISMQR